MDEFDRLLYEGSAQLPPELSELKPPCPWKKPISQICWGLALVTITLNFLGLDTILPAVGAALLWLGLAPCGGRTVDSGSPMPVPLCTPCCAWLLCCSRLHLWIIGLRA